MKFKICILTCLIFSQSTIGHTKTDSYLISNDIKPKYNLQLNGSYPSIKGDEFKEINNSIFKFITMNFDQKGDSYSTEINFEKLYESKNILSFSVNYNISNSTERYFNKYYTVSLVRSKELSLSEYLKDKKIPKVEVLKGINQVISSCTSVKKSLPNYCSDITIQSLIENNTKIDYTNISGFFIKNNSSIGVGVDSNKFTTTFIYNFKTKKAYLK